MALVFTRNFLEILVYPSNYNQFCLNQQILHQMVVDPIHLIFLISE